ncbi:MAG: DUF4838 domain-containing protein [Armatimonadetes bacterium]|nr:DUF4838 domain-containing protein [Armatimonadota bacterium]
MTIARGGRAEAVIVVAKGAGKPEQHAAAELAGFLGQVTGAKFSVTHQPEHGRSNLLVGPQAARLVDPNFSTDGLGCDGIVLRTAGSNLILAGGEPRGTLYAVYTFLEDYVGCRWWTPQVSTIPRKPDLTLGKFSRRYVPPMEHREILIAPTTLDPDWSVRNKCVGELHGYGHFEIMAERGGTRKAWPNGHSFYTVLPPEKYFAEHPEWYSLIDGKRTATPRDHSSLCLTNGEMLTAFLRNTKAEVGRVKDLYPSGTEYVSVSAEDDSGYPCRCQCDACVAAEREEGGPSGLALRFANSVAAAIEKDSLGKLVSMYAYHHTQKPPLHERPRPNVFIYFCPINASFSRPLTDARNKRWNDDLNGWLKICDRVYVYDYPDNCVYPLVPHPNLRALTKNIQNWAKAGVKGYFGDGVQYGTGGTEMAELRAWLVAKLLWDPSQDPDKLIREFTNGYYGPAGKEIVAYLDVMHNAVEASGDWLDLGSPPDAHFLSLETLVAGWSHLEAAEASVKDDPTLRSRVKVAQLPALYVFLVRWKQLKDTASWRGTEWPLSDSAQVVLDQFLKVAESNNVYLDERSRGDLTRAVQQ